MRASGRAIAGANKTGTRTPANRRFSVGHPPVKGQLQGQGRASVGAEAGPENSAGPIKIKEDALYNFSTERQGKPLKSCGCERRYRSIKRKIPAFLKGGANTVLDVLREPVDFCKKSTSKIFRKTARADDALRI